jgi:hypothetical protein
MHPIIARIVVLSVIAALVGLDIVLISLGYASISSQCTTLNRQSNWLLALGLAALWLLWFIVPLFTGK